MSGSSAEAGARGRGLSLALACALGLGTLALFAPTLGFEFVSLDDRRYVTANPWIANGLDPATLRWAFTTFYFSNWHPLTWISYAIDVDLHGLDPAGFHATNVALHIANVLLLFGLLLRGTGRPWPSALAAALFAWHPLHVEPVAWVSERKELLATFFGLLALGAYGAWVRRPRAWRYAGVALCMALSLLAKPMWVTLPLLLLAVDLWPLGRLPLGAKNTASVLRRRALEKAPLVALSVGSATLTLAAQAGAIERVSVAAPARLANAVVSMARYLGLALWPDRLSVHYPHPALPGGVPASVGAIVAAAALLLLLTWGAVRVVRTRPYALAGWAWFAVALLPVLGLVQTGSQAMADRYAYVPLIGGFAAIAWLVDDGLRDLRLARPGLARVAVVLILCALAAGFARSANRVGAWRDSVTLYERSLAATPDSATLHYNLGNRLLSRGESTRARHHYREALRLHPGWPEPQVSLAWLLATSRDPALRDPEAALRLAEAASVAHANRNANTLDTLAAALAAAGDFERAVEIAARAEAIARETGPRALVGAVASRRRLYAARRAYFEGTAPEETDATSKSTVR